MNDKPFLYSLQAADISKYPEKSVIQFCKNVNEKKMPPSQALRLFFEENNISGSATGLIYDLLNKAYPGIQMVGFTFPITDSNYPFGDSGDLDDEGFDRLVAEAWEETQSSSI